MRKNNVEIEFKTAITLDIYKMLLKEFNLEENVFLQTNYYFDTEDLALNKDKIVLRIRQKGDIYKVTLKKQSDKQAFENHVIITKEKALEMIKDGFNTNEFFDDINLEVKFLASLDNYRVSTPHFENTLFLDRCDYHNITEYELEYEVSNFEDGEKAFHKLLAKYNIPYIKSKRKSERALKI